MGQKFQKGSTLFINLVLVLLIVVILSLIVLGLYVGFQSADFTESFGVKRGILQPGDEERLIIQPLVTRRLQALRNSLETVKKEKADLFNLPSETVTPEEVTRRTNKLKEINAKTISALIALARAESSAKYFGFKI